LIVKTSLIFEKRITIFKSVNRFSKLNFSFLHARLISDCHNLAIVDRRNLTGAGVRQRPVAGILPALDAGHHIPAKPAGSGQNGWNPASSGQNGRDSVEFGWIQPNMAGSGRFRPNMT